MAHFAKIIDGVVIQVIVADQEFIDNYQDTVPGTWIQCSYNTIGGIHYERNIDGSLGDAYDDQSESLRKNYPGIGWHYDFVVDAFYPPKPFDSWTLNTTTYLWDCPVDEPDDFNGMNYIWNEETTSWDAE
tara:strand:- start:2176 stop:2565 length:390 start_codon:yes stop_codon:yes gene_type:complete